MAKTKMLLWWKRKPKCPQCGGDLDEVLTKNGEAAYRCRACQMAWLVDSEPILTQLSKQS